MELLKINYTSFWPHFDKENNYFTNILSKKYKVEISNNPDLLFCANDVFNSKEYLKYNCHKIFVGLENERTDWTAFDYALDFDFINNNPKHKRFPLWATWGINELTTKKNPEQIFVSKTKFACMVVSNGNARERIEFFHQLSKYKVVDSGGKYLNNVGGPVKDKKEFIKDYKFVISFENSSFPGYTTEKLIEPMFVNSIPIYWGNSLVDKDFNTKSFINITDFKNFDDAINTIIELDQNREKYLSKLNEPWFNNNTISADFSEESVSEFFDFIVANSKTNLPVCRSYRKYIHSIKRTKKNIYWYLFKVLKLKTSFR